MKGLGEVEKRMKEIRERCERATPGPWEIETYSNYVGYSIYGSMVGCLAERWYAESLSEKENVEMHGNAEFISHARQDIPWLLRRAEAGAKLSEAVKEYRKELERPADITMRLHFRQKMFILQEAFESAGE